MSAYRSSAQDLIYPKPAPRTRDHHKENLREIRNKQQLTRQQQLQKQAEDRRPAVKNKLYANVAPRVDRTGRVGDDSCGGADGDASAPRRQRPFLKAGARNARGAPPMPSEPYISRREKKHEAVPTAEAAAQHVQDLRCRAGGARSKRRDAAEDVRILERQQREKAQREQAKRVETTTKDSGQFGKVPEYLSQRRVELAEEREYLARQRQPELPSGWQRMPDEQRESILSKLHETLATKSQSLQRMPLICEGVGRRRAKVRSTFYGRAQPAQY